MKKVLLIGILLMGNRGIYLKGAVVVSDNFNRTGPIGGSTTTTGGYNWVDASSNYGITSNEMVTTTPTNVGFAALALNLGAAIYTADVTVNFTSGASYDHAGIFLKTASGNIGRLSVRDNGYSFGLTQDTAYWDGGSTTFLDSSSVLTGPVVLTLIYDNSTQPLAPTITQKINGTVVGNYTFASDPGAITGIALYSNINARFDNFTLATIPEVSAAYALYGMGLAGLIVMVRSSKKHRSLS